MEGDTESGVKRNDVLSQSYAECVERVAQQKNDGGFSFELPKEVLEQREKVWDNFFDKYADEASDEVELDVNTMKPVPAEKDEEDEDEEEDDDDEEEDEEKEYYSKCRAPLRKLPALIQYWIDTGNPPYQLVGDEDQTETGSSLSEGEHSRSGHSDVIRETPGKQKSNTSRCSSVDTAAYILSNTNITKKAETQAIVEGAKSSDEARVVKASSLKEISPKFAETTNNAVPSSPSRCQKSPDKIVQAATPQTSKVAPEIERSSIANPLTSPRANNSILSAFEVPEASSPGRQSVKLSEILPEVQEFDEMLKRTNAMSPPKTRSSLAKVRRKPKPQQSQHSSGCPEESRFSDFQSKLQNRRKLYTGRDSPVDLVVERSNGDCVQTSRLSLHPALETAASRDVRSKQLASRARTRRKRKRASQNSQNSSQDGNTTRESDQPMGDDNSRGDVRYTDFFESLGLTPCKLDDGNSRVKRSAAKRSRKIARQILPREAKRVAPINDSMDGSSIKESEDNTHTEDSAFSPDGKARNIAEVPAERILEDKILCVAVERLSDECLARYARKFESKCTENDEFAGIYAPKLRRSSDEKIEILTNLTHDSDNSTIIICSCNENNEQSDSDDFMIANNFSSSKDTLTRTSVVCELSARATNDTVRSKIIDNSDGTLPRAFVKLERLKNANLENSRIKRKSKESVERKDSKIMFKTILESRSQSARSPYRRNIDLSNSNASEGFTIGSRIFVDSNGAKNSENTRQKFVASRILGISIPSDEEEDDFTKFHSDIGSKRDSAMIEETKHETMKKISNADITKDLNDVIIQTGKMQKFCPISTSSDEEDFYALEMTRRTRNFVSRNEKNRGKSKKTDDDEVEETKNGVKVAEPEKQADESNRRKLRSETTVRDEELVTVESGRTRESKGRRKTTKNANSTLEGEAEMKNDDSEARGSNDVRRSNRHKPSASWLPENKFSERNSLGKSNNTKNSPAISRQMALTDAEVLSAWKNRDIDLKNVNFDAESGSSIVSLTMKSIGRRTTRAVRDDSRIDGNSLLFKTRHDSDSDAEFEGLRFSLSDKYARRILEERSKISEVAKSKRLTVSPESRSPKIEGAVTMRTSPRRTFKTFFGRRRRSAARRAKERRRNLFDEDAKSPIKIVDSLDNEAADVEAFGNSGLLLHDDSPTSGTKETSGKQRTTGSKGDSRTVRVSRKNSTKSDQTKNRSPVASQRNGESRGSPLSKKKKLRRTRILGNRTEWDSNDDTDSNDDKISSSLATRTKGHESTTNGNSTKRSSDKIMRDDRESSRKESTRSLFSSIADDTAEDVDLLFGGVTKSPVAKNIVIEKLNFATAKRHKNLSKVGLSTASFRTRLRSDSEDDRDL